MLSITSAMSASGCTDSSPRGDELPGDKYVALFETVEESYNVTEGQMFAPYTAVPPPFFDYDGSYGRARNYTPVNDSLKILYGKFYFTFSPDRNRGRFDVRGIYSYPDAAEKNLTVTGTDAHGTVYMRYHDQNVTLKAGDRWTSPAIAAWTETHDFNTTITSFVNGTTPEIMPVHVYYKLRFVTTFSVENKGMFNKSDIK